MNRKRIACALALAGLISFQAVPVTFADTPVEASEVKAEALPPFVYTGTDPYMQAVCEWLCGPEQNAYYRKGQVMIPVPIILYVDGRNESDVKVWGNFWTINYNLEGDTLHLVSGGEMPALFRLEKVGDRYRVKRVRKAGDGAAYARDIRAFCLLSPQPKMLFDAYMRTYNLRESPAKDVRKIFIEDYVRENHLDIKAFKDYGWDAVELEVKSEE